MFLCLTCENGQSALCGEVPLAGSIQKVHLVRLSSDVEQFPVEVLGGGRVALVELVAQEPLENVGLADPGSTQHHYSVTVLGLGQSELQQVHGPLRLALGGELPSRGAGGGSVRHRVPPALLDHPDDAHAGLGEVWCFGVLLGCHCALNCRARGVWWRGERVEHVEDAINGKVKLLSCVHLLAVLLPRHREATEDLSPSQSASPMRVCARTEPTSTIYTWQPRAAPASPSYYEIALLL